MQLVRTPRCEHDGQRTISERRNTLQVRYGNGIDLVGIDPPYHGLSHFGTTAIEPQALLVGSMIAVVLSGPITLRSLQPAASVLRECAPAQRHVIIVEQLMPREAVEAARLGVLCGISTVIWEVGALESELRRQLQQPVQLGPKFVKNLSAHGIRLGNAERLLCSILVHGPSRGLAYCYSHLELSAPAARARLRLLRLPSPSVMLALARAIHALLDLQRNPDKRISESAYAYGYCDQQALNRSFRRFFGSTPSYMRQLIGWESALGRAVVRLRFPRRRIG